MTRGAQKGTTTTLQWETCQQRSTRQVPSLMRTASSWCREVEAEGSAVKQADSISSCNKRRAGSVLWSQQELLCHPGKRLPAWQLVMPAFAECEGAMVLGQEQAQASVHSEYM